MRTHDTLTDRKSPRRINRTLAYQHLLSIGIEPDRAAYFCFAWSDWRMFNSNVGY